MSPNQSEQQKSDRQVKITLTRSLLGRPEKHRRVAKALGLTKSQRSVVHYDTPIIRGMINKISHLLTVEVA
ncbi:MAG: rpmD [Vampirovibrio sp.]|jgi:large subunit ribosomal protein L30|nr:rpmD [Vampirovibrio sp.]